MGPLTILTIGPKGKAIKKNLTADQVIRYLSTKPESRLANLFVWQHGKQTYPGAAAVDWLSYNSYLRKGNPSRKRKGDLTIKLVSGTEKQLKSLLRKAGYAVGTLTNSSRRRNPGLDMYAASMAPGIAERITRGAQGLVGRRRKKRRNPKQPFIIVKRHGIWVLVDSRNRNKVLADTQYTTKTRLQEIKRMYIAQWKKERY